ncbi:hypothetical protein [Streptomyces sp. NPDC048473]|uniref:hypothetical protein n=1 Tax=unclassified Streptomyces TaxID=2593676 RepID=UPI00371F99EC
MPRAGRTVAAAGRSVVRSGGGAAPGGAAGIARPEPLGRAGVVRCCAAVVVTGAAGAEAVAGGIPAMCRRAIAGRRATIRGGAVRRGRTAAGRARCGEAGAGTVFAGCCGAGAAVGAEAGPGPAADAVFFAGAVPAVASGLVGPLPRACRPGAPRPDEPGGVVPLDRWMVAGTGFSPALPLPVALPAVAGVRSAEGSASPSAPVRAARRSSGPPGDVEGALPGRATPWMRPTGADGSTAWPSWPPNAGFCHEARPDLNRSPSLTPIEDRATVTVGGATCRQPPSQPPSC